MNCYSIVKSNVWHYSIIILVGACAIFLGIEALYNEDSNGIIWKSIDHIFTGLFTIEIVIRLCAGFQSEGFFSDRTKIGYRKILNGNTLWNYFDLLLVVLGLVNLNMQFTDHGEYIFVARLLRITRLARLFEVSDKLRDIEYKILSVLPTIRMFILLLGVLIYSYAILGFYMMGISPSEAGYTVDAGLLSAHDYFGSFQSSLSTMFTLTVMDDWSNIFKTVTTNYPYKGTVFLISYALITGIIFLNVFLAVLVSSVEEKLADKDDIDKLEKMEYKIASMEELIIKQNEEILLLSRGINDKLNSRPIL